ncbi:3-oxoacyl-[acyl-carrier-protein] synthase II [Clostridium acetobutylicum]|uniref:3-oxoacyl-[acyl-carrier-protein] synthase 2 n=1 Tax=Clostridium acetobutylicum (strain ATCC 824 / DSM 792 / JCM 1419 / IAM 19013 / LMG 5710 / NBRC 13948 / NRRL B-527 / VKM B-1787 / 2291 / W) TaxID=272562 RepID=Q97DA7_CLOAB|nr:MULTISPECIES: beta-ketoacyl-ACP synthase II [Clostridium]AAK81496.1 3-oxoacyl-(acyl-carrier-protein) synthase I [Clostridium acetobutylicum ATCC 824]ADZ22617.1 3-oxoacyl-(acyl carrier protein) synthase II [Clostridium acetobutylicum EA 2018]AEI34722.1 3-oxoacyl-(acyl carrier protein) synthase II [Clostridium acetobutylicum DSM 1731]AWV80830.1 beta-ketoacyl-[acyl-carrier-protein] synthase II [Clostridium acetobutylicum]MBC2393844.1 beta-ketoacyl-ACP synthase II [Clostridium acetobutylicum]
MNRRVVITGIGAVTPVGNNADSFWCSIKEGKCGIDKIKAFDATDFKVKLAAEVKDFTPEDFIDKREANRMDRFSQFAIVAADEAIKDSKLDLESIDKNRFGVIVGSGIGGIGTIEKQDEKLITKGPGRVSPMTIPMIIANMASGNLAIRYGAKGICTTIVTACASANNSIGESFRNIKFGYSDVMISGGSEAGITPLSLAGFASMKAVTKSEDPKRASIPFDKDRSGFVMGEGSGIVILEELEHALKRGAKIYAEIVGYGATCDAYHITSPAPNGEGGARAMKLAMEEDNVRPEDISYINAHGTSTAYNDSFETQAIKTVLGEYAYKVPVSSTKSMTGHLLGAGGAVEAIICAKAIEEGFIPPTIGYKEADPECDLDYVPNEGRNAEVNYVLSNSLGFGGHNATLLFKKYK